MSSQPVFNCAGNVINIKNIKIDTIAYTPNKLAIGSPVADKIITPKHIPMNTIKENNSEKTINDCHIYDDSINKF